MHLGVAMHRSLRRELGIQRTTTRTKDVLRRNCSGYLYGGWEAKDGVDDVGEVDH